MATLKDELAFKVLFKKGNIVKLKSLENYFAIGFTDSWTNILFNIKLPSLEDKGMVIKIDNNYQWIDVFWFESKKIKRHQRHDYF